MELSDDQDETFDGPAPARGLRGCDAPELTDVLLAAFVSGPPPAAVHEEIQRFLWNTCNFAEALPLKDAVGRIRDGSAGNFIYHQKSGILFTRVSGGTHQLLMAYLESLHKTDFTLPNLTWDYDQAYSFNATSKLAEDFIVDGHGLFQSSVGKASAVHLGDKFVMSDLETEAFKEHGRLFID